MPESVLRNSLGVYVSRDKTSKNQAIANASVVSGNKQPSSATNKYKGIWYILFTDDIDFHWHPT